MGFLRHYFNKFTEQGSKDELLAIVNKIAALDTEHPKLGIPSLTRKLMAEGYFDIDKRPWSFLVMTCYIIAELGSEAGDDEEIGDLVFKLYQQADAIFQKPKRWMYEAVDTDSYTRYLYISERNELPNTLIGEPKIPRNIRRIHTISHQYYVMLVYMFLIFDFGPASFELDLECPSGFLVLKEARDFVFSIKDPPKEVLNQLNVEVATIIFAKISESLSTAEKQANDFVQTKCTMQSADSIVTKLEKIASAFGYDATFTPK